MMDTTNMRKTKKGKVEQKSKAIGQGVQTV